MRIAVLSSKGGVGKTTIATNLAGGFAASGYPTLLVDADPQGSSVAWGEQREEQGLVDVPVAHMVRATLARDLGRGRVDASHIIIDGAPRLEGLLVSAIEAADHILVPVQPSALDLWAVVELLDLIRARQGANDGRPTFCGVVSRQIPGTRAAGSMAAAAEQLDLPLLSARICQRVVYSEAAQMGRTVMERAPKSKGAMEMQAVLDELNAMTS